MTPKPKPSPKKPKNQGERMKTKRGRPVTSNATVQVLFNVSPKLKRAMVRAAKNAEVSLSQWLRSLAEAEIEVEKTDYDIGKVLWDTRPSWVTWETK